MQESRTFAIQKKPKIILDRRFPIVNGLGLGDKGQMLLKVTVEEERKEFQDDDVERIIKTVLIRDVEMITKEIKEFNAL